MKASGPLALLILSTISLGVSAATFNVSDTAEFQSALTAAQSNGEDDIINVAAGTYFVSLPFLYTAAATEDYDLEILGADSDLVILDGTDAGAILQIDTSAVENDDNVGVRVTNMTFQNGFASGNGGALSIILDEFGRAEGGSGADFVEVTGCEFYNNDATGNGGAIYFFGAVSEFSPTDPSIGANFVDLTIQNNTAGGDGGGIYAAGGTATNLRFDDIDFFDNSAFDFGGGVNIQGASGLLTSSATFFDVMFADNEVTGTSGGGGAIAMLGVDLWVDTVGFVDNIAPSGGGIYLRVGTRMGVINSGFVGNTANLGDGGAIFTDNAAASGIVMQHNTIVANSALMDGAGVYISRGLPGSVDLYSNIIYGNFGEFPGWDLYVNDNAGGGPNGVTLLLYNNLLGNWTTFCTTSTDCTANVTEEGTVSQDPLLTDVSARPEPDIHLLPSSPAIDTGHPTGHPSYPAVDVDFEFDDRPQDGNNDSVALPDIGADEAIGTPVQGADITAVYVADPDPVTGGENLTYTFTVSNNGPDDATGVTLNYMLPAFLDVTVFSVTPSQGTCTESATDVNCVLGSVTNGSTATVTLVLTTPEVGIVTYMSSDVSVTANEFDTDPTNNGTMVTTTITPAEPAQADVAVVVTDSPDPVFSGGPQITWDITLTNNGPDEAEVLVLTHTVPGEVTDVQVTPPTGYSCGPPGPTVTCQVASLALNESVSMSVVATPLTVMTATPMTFASEVTSVSVDPVTENNSVMETTTINPPEADMMVSVSSSSSNPSIDEQVTFTVTVTNDGPSDNSNVFIELSLPAEGSTQSLTPSQGTCKGTVGTVTCFLGDMDAGSDATITWVVTVPSYAVEMLMSALVSGDMTDPATGNDTGSVTINVIEAIELLIRGVGGGSGSFGLIGLLGLLVATVLAIVPAAQTRAESPWYVGAAIGESNANYSAGDLTSDLGALGWTISDVSTNDSDAAWKVYGGFMFNENFADEVGFVELGEVKTQYTTNIPPSDIDDILSDTYSVHPYLGRGWVTAGVYSMPFADDQWAFLARAGAFVWEADIDVAVISGGTGSVSGDDSGTDLMYGLGIEWRAADSFSVTAEWERYRLNDWVDVPAIGFRWYFE